MTVAAPVLVGERDVSRGSGERPRVQGSGRGHTESPCGNLCATSSARQRGPCQKIPGSDAVL